MKIAALLELPDSPREFLKLTGTTDVRMLIREYARYMLELANVNRMPIDIDKVIEYHGFRQPKRPLREQMGRRGMQVGRAIAVNTDDSMPVQRFSKGHELTEALFSALKEEKPCRFSPNEWAAVSDKKEQLCDYGAAEFLLPAHLFFPYVKWHRMKLVNAVEWAEDYIVSLTATVRRMLEANEAPGIFLIVQERFKRYNESLRKAYGMLWNDTTFSSWKPDEGAELRIMKEWHSPQTKSIVKLTDPISRETSIHRTFRAGITDQVERCNDLYSFEYLKGHQHTETLLVKMNNVPTVMVLIHPRDINY